MPNLKTCPTCGQPHLRRVTRDVPCNFKGQPYTAPAITFHECPDCGERLYDRDAMRKMESFRPSATKPRGKRKIA